MNTDKKARTAKSASERQQREKWTCTVCGGEIRPLNPRRHGVMEHYFLAPHVLSQTETTATRTPTGEPLHAGTSLWRVVYACAACGASQTWQMVRKAGEA